MRLCCRAISVCRQHALLSPAACLAAAGGGVGGMLKAVIDTVIGNLQLSITNVHIRWVGLLAAAAAAAVAVTLACTRLRHCCEPVPPLLCCLLQVRR